jgi:hypothetical protein
MRISISGTALPNGMAPELLSRYEKTREGAVKEFGLRRSDDLARAIHSTAGNVSLPPRLHREHSVFGEWLRQRTSRPWGPGAAQTGPESLSTRVSDVGSSARKLWPMRVVHTKGA